METIERTRTGDRHSKCVDMSKRIGRDIDRDVIHGRKFEVSKKFLPDGLCKIERLPFLDAGEKRLVSQIQGRTYANIFGLVERFIAAKVQEVRSRQWLSDQNALEALVRLCEELKHQEMFRSIDRLAAATMAEGYAFLPEPEAVASMVLGKSPWAVLALTCHIELFVLAHYRESIDLDPNLSALCKDVFLYHWREESQHAALVELEWMREDERLTLEQRDRAIDELIELLASVDGILQSQSRSDADYFMRTSGRTFGPDEAERIRAGVLDAYRRQCIESGVQGRFDELLSRFITPVQLQRIGKALAPS